VTAGLGEWDAEHSTNGPAPPAPARSAIETAIASLDVDAFVQEAARAALRRRLEAVAAAAVDNVLDDPVLAQLREAADAAARRALQEPAAADLEDADEPAELYFPDLLTFVHDYLAPMYRRNLSGPGVTWCPEWWNHAEAIARLEALWRAWEFLRLDAHTGMSVWFRDHADHHMAVLLNADGPFKGCKPEAHAADRLKPLPLIVPPDDRATLR
jgi:hypothetical protein